MMNYVELGSIIIVAASFLPHKSFLNPESGSSEFNGFASSKCWLVWLAYAHSSKVETQSLLAAHHIPVFMRLRPNRLCPGSDPTTKGRKEAKVRTEFKPLDCEPKDIVAMLGFDIVATRNQLTIQ